MAHWDQIVIGAGSSALNFLFAAGRGENKKFISKKTLVIGEDDLWRGAHGGASGNVSGQRGFEMGQPEDLLYPLHQSAKPTGNVSYLVTSRYTQTLADLKSKLLSDSSKSGAKLEFLRDRVKPMSVRRLSGGFVLSTVKFSETQTAPQVIIASGAGPNQTLDTMRIPVGHKERLGNKTGRPYPEMISGEEYVKWHPNNPGMRIMVYGPAPSAAWAAAHAMFSRPSMLLWMARSGFVEANPAGRNSAIIMHASESDAMWIGTVSAIEVLDVPTGPRLRVTMERSQGAPNLRIPLRTEGDSPFESLGQIRVLTDQRDVEVDQFVYATGADARGDFGPGNILEDSLRRELVPYYDKAGRFNSDTALVAFTTPREDLWVVGASVFRALGGIEGGLSVKQLQERYQTIPEMFCDAGTPPEGLAVVKALIKSVTGFNEPGDTRFNWNTADKVELVAYLNSRYPGVFTPVERGSIADVVIARRSGRDVGRGANLPTASGHYPAFGLTEAEFNQCISDEALRLGKRIDTKWQVQVPKPVKLTV